MTALEFFQRYAERSGRTTRWLADTMPNREVRPCHCDYALCEGWQLGRVDERDPWDEPGIPLTELAGQRP